MRFTLVKSLFLLFVAVCFLTIVYNIYNLENTELLKAWPFNRTRNTSAYISFEESAIHLPSGFCNSEILATVIVYSAPQNFASRKVIRETWASQTQILDHFIDFYFLIGRANDPVVQDKLEEEYLLYDDIVQDDFVECYYNLSLKSLFMLKNVARHCSDNVKYLVKIDDDMYLNTQNLVKTLNQSDRNNLILGHLFEHVGPIRSASSKWYAPYYMYEEDYYPPFVSGTSYVMSIDVVQKLYEAALAVPLYHLEDVYVTGFLAQHAGIKPQNNNFFSFWNIKFRPCAFMNLITTHEYTPEQLPKLHKSVTQSNLRELCASTCRYRLFSKCDM